jgi:hypothetical protein
VIPRAVSLSRDCFASVGGPGFLGDGFMGFNNKRHFYPFATDRVLNHFYPFCDGLSLLKIFLSTNRLGARPEFCSKYG